jgi:signal transduction histidine kinase
VAGIVCGGRRLASSNKDSVARGFRHLSSKKMSAMELFAPRRICFAGTVLWGTVRGGQLMTYAFAQFGKLDASALDASAIVHPRDDSESEALRKGLLKRPPERGEIIDLVDDSKKSVREAAIGIPEPTVVAATAAIAHEVKQPLAAMVMSANAGLRWLKRAEPNLDEVQAALERIVRDGHRANEVIDNVRAIFGKDRHQKARVNVNTLIGEVLGLIQEELEIRRISVRSELIDGLPEVMAERVQLQQVLLNLVMNAVDAMSAVTGRERRLTVKSQLDVHGVRIAVEDSGTGIDRGYVDRIFDSFFTTKPYGMGMGLSICRSIIESHGGRLWFSSRSSHGTTFYVQLPAEVENRLFGSCGRRSNRQVRMTVESFPARRQSISWP